MEGLLHGEKRFPMQAHPQGYRHQELKGIEPSAH